MELEKFGIWTSYRAIGEENAGAAAALVERLGYGALWLGGSPRLPTLRPLLQATDSLVIATGIVNVWAYEPAQLAEEYAALSAEFPDRLLLGIGIGHPEATSHYEKPLTKMRTFLDGLTSVPRESMCIAALGPKMLDLSAERTRGTHPYFTPPAHTRFARERLGVGALVAPELAVVVDTEGDPAAAKAAARRYAALYLNLRNYTSNLLNFGFTEADIADGGSDRLIDTIVPQGGAADLAAAAREHVAAGADHVCLQTAGVQGVPEREWTELAAELIG
ncbi:MAG TPA: TIGR03620 family F420-dependent LLM class oxidoreductase [Solirubrobacteraceae bacterium]|nr:TIGR03620 family F420-dependent LLM class oxidoreductase [Solirubrobacteraceae bacterium]